ncbi:nitroreductase family deazaflavin-dependent oxidoreductase [Rhodococcus rhodochrous]|uniref:nitroreductase family deazaflavin-dependent oxidoreductase n=1 Tax=Rhodococcus rhodochrous TaxID=1829 RepID=UPI00132F0662|nr:nitroreductase family deazaflavin-dependent oxidoreductase [Rhodococcus rhodochrous]QHG82087.1 nitroreductase family deazaflavin-dependent oxidoreductase [Rhodococcus rhodochrous]QOH58239.1 nitroreductase family deazaflavin-dependent oxidoreductase [Rhodococcus rhodochrous]
MNPLRPVAVRIGALPWLPRYSRPIIAVDKTIQRLTRGKVTLLAIAGLPSLVLTVKGRKTGEPRSTPLLCVPHDGGWLVVGSNWGHPKAPSWAVNLHAADRAQVLYDGHEYAVSVRIAEGDERERLWKVLLQTWPNYALYAKRTDRVLPVFVLTPLES